MLPIPNPFSCNCKIRKKCFEIKTLKNYLNTSIGQKRPSDLSLLSKEAEHLQQLQSSFAIDDLINQFVEKRVRKKQKFYFNFFDNLFLRLFITSNE